MKRVWLKLQYFGNVNKSIVALVEQYFWHDGNNVKETKYFTKDFNVSKPKSSDSVKRESHASNCHEDQKAGYLVSTSPV